MRANHETDARQTRRYPHYILAEQTGGVWKPSPALAADMAKFLQGADPEQFEMWVEELEDA
jgi:hypothetical protein